MDALRLLLLLLLLHQPLHFGHLFLLFLLSQLLRRLVLLWLLLHRLLVLDVLLGKDLLLLPSYGFEASGLSCSLLLLLPLLNEVPLLLRLPHLLLRLLLALKEGLRARRFRLLLGGRRAFGALLGGLGDDFFLLGRASSH